MEHNASVERLTDIRIKLIGIPIVSVFISLLFKSSKQALFCTEYFIGLLISLLVTTVLWVGNSTLYLYFHKKYPHLHQMRVRVIWTTLSCLTFSTVAFTCVSTTIHLGIRGFITWDLFWLDLKITLLITTLILLLYETVFLFRQWKKTAFDAARLEKENVQAQLDSLRNQINPHFLFNSLNTLINIIPENPKTATDFTQKLANVYRYLLSVRNKELVDLATEMEFIRSYLFLLSVRFEENLRIEMAISDEMLTRLVPPVSIQMLIENAIKHNVVSKEKPLHLSIYTENDCVIVQNNLQPKQEKEESTGIGLDNISKRYAILSNRNMEIVPTEGYFTVTLPLLQLA